MKGSTKESSIWKNLPTFFIPFQYTPSRPSETLSDYDRMDSASISGESYATTLISEPGPETPIASDVSSRIPPETVTNLSLSRMLNLSLSFMMTPTTQNSQSQTPTKTRRSATQQQVSILQLNPSSPITRTNMVAAIMLSKQGNILFPMTRESKIG
jgi:hypothetical protein